MTGQTHSQVALDLLEEIGWSDTDADQKLIGALTHATLALAEQQRLGNMIALVARNDAVQKRSDTAGMLDGKPVTVAELEARNASIFEIVREGLGL